MRRLLPAHLIVAACAVGLAASDAVRVHDPVGLALGGALASALIAPAGWGRVGLVAALALATAWWWGSTRLDALDHSVLAPRIGTADRFLAVTTAEARAGAFDLRQVARVRGERVELALPLGRAPPQGARLSILAVVKAPRGPSHGFDERTWLRRQGVHVVLHVDEWHVVGRRGGLGGVADRLRRWLRRSGLYHLLAVSGQNVVLLAGGVLALAGALGIGRAWAHVGALAAIGAYVLAVGPQPSVIRAAIAGAAVSLAWLAGRLRDAWHLLLVAACVLLAWNPYTLYDAGFQLSFGAVAAIFVLGSPFLRALEGYPVPARLRSPIAISAACTLVTAPILWLEFGRVPLYGVAANALVELAVPPLLALSFATAAVSPIAPGVAEVLAWANGWVAVYIATCARAVSALPAAQVSGRAAAVAAAASLGIIAASWRGLRPGRTARR